MSCCSPQNNRFPNKHSIEDAILEFDFSSSLEPTETIIQIADLLVEVLAGEDLTPGAFLDGAASISGQSVLQPVHNGLPGVSYLFTVVINTSLRENLVMQGYITVR